MKFKFSLAIFIILFNIFSFSQTIKVIDFHNQTPIENVAIYNSDNTKTALRLINCLNTGGTMTFRDDEDQVSAQYFCRVRSGQMNFSNNPTFVSGSDGTFAEPTFRTNPKTYITTVGLYSDSSELLAVAKTSQPIVKSFDRETLIRIKLQF